MSFSPSPNQDRLQEGGMQVPKVVVSGTPESHTPPEERDISNRGWIASPNSNFDKPRKEKRSSSFGPLSIIRLSPSPLARTPSPTPPEYENYENERSVFFVHQPTPFRFRRCAKVALVVFIFLGFGLGTALYFYQKGLIA